MTEEQRIELVLLEYRTASRPEIRQVDADIVEDHFAYLIAQGLLERRYGKAGKKGARTSTLVRSETGERRLSELKQLAEGAHALPDSTLQGEK